jgi:hypothetical protein
MLHIIPYSLHGIGVRLEPKQSFEALIAALQRANLSHGAASRDA